MTEEKLIEYACEKFQEERYDEALEAFILAYSKGYEQDWILNNVYQCYVEGNEEEFQRAYESGAAADQVPYEECLLDFIPYREGEYYIFDKELRIFRGIFSVPELKGAEPNKMFEQLEFSGAALELDWNWNERRSVLAAAESRSLYMVAHDIKRCASFWKIPELEGYVKNVRLYSDCGKLQEFFHIHTSEYLPLLVFGTPAEQEELTAILNQEHAYRLTPEGRNTDRVILTIGIPTYNRGNLLLKRLENLLPMPYDAEIEIAISKNGMESYQEEYEKISRMSDARINYYDHGRTLNAEENWRYVVEMAHGKYVLLVSDEDDVILSSLEHYLKLLTEHPQANVIRARSTYQGAFLENRHYEKKGLAAFDRMFMCQNYLSGLIVRRHDFLEVNFKQLEQFSENEFYKSYPHEWWCALLSQQGDYMEEPVYLINEGESSFDEEKSPTPQKWEGSLPYYATYATYEARMKQFAGIIEFLHWMMKDNQEGAAVGLYWAIKKTAILLRLARRYEYEKEHFPEWVDHFCQEAMHGIDGFDFPEQNAALLLKELKDSCIQLLVEHEKLNAAEE